MEYEIYYEAEEGKVSGSTKLVVPQKNYEEEEVKEIMKDEEDIADIKAGKVWFKIRSYESHGKTCFSPDWLEEDEVNEILEATKKEK